jgi:hypothetical protein
MRDMAMFQQPTLDLSLAAAFNQKHMEVRGQRLGVKLPHHHCDLTSMVSGMIRQMLHEGCQSDLCRAKRKHCFQGFTCHPIHELGLFFLDFQPL